MSKSSRLHYCKLNDPMLNYAIPSEPTQSRPQNLPIQWGNRKLRSLMSNFKSHIPLSNRNNENKICKNNSDLYRKVQTVRLKNKTVFLYKIQEDENPKKIKSNLLTKLLKKTKENNKNSNLLLQKSPIPYKILRNSQKQNEIQKNQMKRWILKRSISTQQGNKNEIQRIKDEEKAKLLVNLWDNDKLGKVCIKDIIIGLTKIGLAGSPIFTKTVFL